MAFNPRLTLKLAGVALQSLSHHKLRTGLTMLGVIIGVGAVIVMIGIGEGAKARVARHIKSLGTNLLVVRPGFSKRGPVHESNVVTLRNPDADAIATLIPHVAAVSPVFGRQSQVKYLARNMNTSVLGVTQAYVTVNNFQVAEGRFLDEEDVRTQRKVAVIGESPAKELFETRSPVGETIKIQGSNFKIIGRLKGKGQAGRHDPDDQILVPLTTAQHRLYGVDYLQGINVMVDTESNMEDTQAEIEALLRVRHRIRDGQEPDFTIRNQKEILETMSQVGDTFTLLLLAVAAVSMLVGGIGIMNIMLVSVSERTREIGIRKAVGARRRHILFQFLVEAVVLSLVGGVIGVFAGVGTAKLLAMGGKWETVVTGWSIVLSFSIAAGTGIFFGLYPASKASKLDPIEALRYE